MILLHLFPPSSHHLWHRYWIQASQKQRQKHLGILKELDVQLNDFLWMKWSSQAIVILKNINWNADSKYNLLQPNTSAVQKYCWPTIATPGVARIASAKGLEYNGFSKGQNYCEPTMATPGVARMASAIRRVVVTMSLVALTYPSLR